jgi:hypothetical protein
MKTLIALLVRKFLCCHHWHPMGSVLKCDLCGKLRIGAAGHVHRFVTDQVSDVTRSGTKSVIGRIYFQHCDGCGQVTHYEAKLSGVL